MSRPRPSCSDKAAELLALRPHFRAQLAAKLAARGYPEDEVGAALDRLAAQGYLDDRRTARDFAAARRARGPIGRRRLAAELARRGAPAEAIAEVLAALDEEGGGDDLAPAREAARRWATRSAGGRRAGGHRAGDRAALARHLDRLGFSRHAILEVLNEGEEAP